MERDDCRATVGPYVGDRPSVDVLQPVGERVQLVGEQVPVGVQRLEVLDGEGVPVAEFPQSLARMGPASSRFYSAVVDRLPSHDGSSGLARQVGNAVLKEDTRGARLAKEHKETAGGSTPPWRPSWPTTGPRCWPVTAA